MTLFHGLSLQTASQHLVQQPWALSDKPVPSKMEGEIDTEGEGNQKEKIFCWVKILFPERPPPSLPPPQIYMLGDEHLSGLFKS